MPECQALGRPLRFHPQSPTQLWLVDVAKWLVKRATGRAVPIDALAGSLPLAALQLVVLARALVRIFPDMDEARLAEVAADCGDSLILAFDVRDDAALAEATAKAIAWKGGIDIAFANAGISQRSRALKTDMQVYRDIIAVDLTAQIAFSQGLIGHMAERGSGALGFISSIAGKVGVPLRTAILIGLVQCVAMIPGVSRSGAMSPSSKSIVPASAPSDPSCIPAGASSPMKVSVKLLSPSVAPMTSVSVGKTCGVISVAVNASCGMPPRSKSIASICGISISSTTLPICVTSGANAGPAPPRSKFRALSSILLTTVCAMSPSALSTGMAIGSSVGCSATSAAAPTVDRNTSSTDMAILNPSPGLPISASSGSSTPSSRRCASGCGAITSIQAVYVPADDFTDPAAVHTFSHLSASIVLSRKRASEGLFPAIDPLQSSSKMVTPGIVGERHYTLAQAIRRTLAQYAELKDIIAMLGLEQLSPDDRKVVARARRLERFLTQPFFTTEQFTGLKGRLVSLNEALDGCERILADEFKDLPERALYMIGAVDEAMAKAQGKSKPEPGQPTDQEEAHAFDEA